MTWGLRKSSTGSSIEAEMDEDHNINESSAHMTAAGCLFGSQSLPKRLYRASLDVGVLKIVGLWDQGQGWSSRWAAAV